MKQVITIPNLQIIEEQMGICEVEDHFFHHEADAHGRRGVLLGGRGETCVSGVLCHRSLPSSGPTCERRLWSVFISVAPTQPKVCVQVGSG